MKKFNLRASWITLKEKIYLLRDSAEDKIHKVIFISLVLGFLLVLYQISFPKEKIIEDWVNNFLRQFPRILMFLYLGKWFVNSILSRRRGIFHRDSAIELTVFLTLLLFNQFKNYWHVTGSEYFLYILLISLFFLRILEVSSKIKASLMSPPILFTISFLVLIMWGTAMLLLPHATNGRFRFVDAAFTATSAVTTCGLSVIDISTKFTGLGHQIILALFLLGGLGLMTFTNFFGILLRGGSSLRNQLMLSDIVELKESGSLFSVLMKILLYAFFIEILGGIFIYYSIKGDFAGGAYETWFFSFFHSVSAFTTAGFSTIQQGVENSLLKVNYNFLTILSFLGIFGAVGYPVVVDLWSLVRNWTKGTFRYLVFGEKLVVKPRILSVHTKLVLTTISIIVVLGAVLFYFLEYNNALLEYEGFKNKAIVSFFSSSMSSTSGLTSVNMSTLAQGTILIFLLQMWIGGAPNSAAGGIKVTTFSLAILNVVSLVKGNTRVEIFGREINPFSILRSYAVIFVSFILIGIGIFLISIFDPHLSLQTITFECFSAYGTVGKSLGITPALSDQSKWVLIFLMFLGRVGLFTILFGLFSSGKKSTNYKYPREDVQVV